VSRELIRSCQRDLTCHQCRGARGWSSSASVWASAARRLVSGRCLSRSSGFDLEAQAAAAESDREALQAARHELDAARPAGPQLPPDERLVAARAAFDRAFAAYQRRLAAFLNVALNEHPRAAATRRVLELYADEAVRWAREVERRGGDMNAARQRLREVASDFEAIDARCRPPSPGRRL
jgi:hypothetical protein